MTGPSQCCKLFVVGIAKPHSAAPRPSLMCRAELQRLCKSQLPQVGSTATLSLARKVC